MMVSITGNLSLVLTPLVGSSNNSTLGRWAKATAMSRSLRAP